MFTVASMVMSHYRNKEIRGGKYITVTFLDITLIVIGRVFETVLPSIYVAKGLRYFESMMLIIATATFYYYLFVYMFPLYRNGSDGFYNKMKIMFLIVLIFLGINTKGTFLIESYSFFNVVYSFFYIGLLCSLLGMIVISSAVIFKSENQMHKIYTNKKIFIWITLLFTTPIFIYILALMKKSDCIDFIELFVYFIFCIAINTMSYSTTPFGLTTLAFDKIGDMIVDYVFVVDTNSNMIYKNKATNDTKFFVKNENVDVFKIKSLFRGSIEEKKNALGNTYIKLIKDNKQYYFTYKLKDLKNEDKLIGYMITITDITELMKLVYSLKERKEKAEEANKQLKNYSKVVYHLEKEKQISLLLEEIIKTREKAMEKLIIRINNLESKLGQDDFESYIEDAIKHNGDILNDVRQAVTTYREHYGG
jgi:hypothetical protein